MRLGSAKNKQIIISSWRLSPEAYSGGAAYDMGCTLMIDLTKETLDKVYKKQKNTISLWWIAGIIIFILYYFFLRIIPDRTLRYFILFSLYALLIIFMRFTFKKLIMSGFGRLSKKAYKVLQQDFMSESSVDMLYRYIGQAKKYPERVRLTLLLADIQTIRGKTNEALQIIYSVDRSGFDKYPDLGMSFYSEIIEIYSYLEDYDSVLRAYSDGESFIDRAAENNYTCCITAFGAMINVEKARGNYRRALDLRLIKNEYENLFNSSTGASQQGTPLNRFYKGAVFMETAELFYLCGDLESAGKYLDIGGPMLSASPAQTENANRLSAKIREAMAQG
ncbi:MAG: hypothetical protein MSJ26_03155 [Oscillospiraceae bacterium]|nr:hypothetical protein [Oscillospiraceae bacterium]